MTQITAMDYTNTLLRLKHKKTGEQVQVGEVITDFRGEDWILTGGAAPHKSSSTGHVYVRNENWSSREFYPTVFGLEWV